MSRLRRRLMVAARHDGGFSLIEVAVAIAIFGIAISALVPVMLKAIQITTTSKLNTQAKQLGLTRVESMRNLPYWIAFDNGQYRDVLDIYFRDRIASGALEASDPCTTRGFVATSSSYRCTVAAVAGFPEFSQVVEVQFLNANRAVVVPSATYNARATINDRPVSQMLGVTVTTSWQTPTGQQDAVLRTQIANAETAPRQLQTRAEAVALKVSSYLPGEASEFQVIAGSVAAEGALSTAASAGVSAVGAQAGLSSGSSVIGAAVTQSAPADVASSSATLGGADFGGPGCLVACIGPTEVTGSTAVKVSGGVPLVATSGSPATAALKRGAGARGFSFSNTIVAQRDPALQLHLLDPMVSFGNSGSAGDIVARASGYLTATQAPVASTAVANASTLSAIRLFPTSFASDGLVQVQLTSAAVSCASTGGAGTPTGTWAAVVKVYSQLTNSYTSYPISNTSAVQLPAPSSIQVTSTFKLDHWIDSWSGATSAHVVPESTGRIARGSLPAAVTILTKPTRAGDPSSSLAVEVGRLACLAEDQR